MAAVNEAVLSEAFDSTVGISEDVKRPLSESEEMDHRQKSETKNEQMVCSPTADSEWSVGAACRAVWSGDGKVYPATLISVEGECCRVRFDVYKNEEDVKLSALQRPNATMLTPVTKVQDWKPGSRCRAVYSEDGLVYPAVILWVKGERCRIRFDNYNNEEEQEVANLLSPDELHGRTRSSKAKEKRRGEKDADQEKKDTKEDPSSHNFPLYPPFPPSLDPISFLSPPPLALAGAAGDKDSASSMLMLWYMCGFHTGCYMTRQMFRSTSKNPEHD